MEKIFQAVDRVLVAIAVVALILMTSVTVVSVAGRYLLSMPIPDDLVMSEMLMVAVVFLPLATVQKNREHVFVSMFTDKLPARYQAYCELGGMIIGLVFFAILTAATFGDFKAAWDVGAYFDGSLNLPEWPSRFVVFFGVLVFTLRLLFDIVQTSANPSRR